MEGLTGEKLSIGNVKIKHKETDTTIQIIKICLFSMPNTPFVTILYIEEPILIKLSYNIVNDIILIIENEDFQPIQINMIC
jgi:hypothetical protein